MKRLDVFDYFVETVLSRLTARNNILSEIRIILLWTERAILEIRRFQISLHVDFWLMDRNS